MRRLPTKHRAINIMEFADEGWDLPRDLRRDPDVDPFLLPQQANAYAAVEQKTVKVWLMVGDTLHHLKDLPAERWSMVMPLECGIQDPSTLEPQRVTHGISPKWTPPGHSRSLATPLWSSQFGRALEWISDFCFSCTCTSATGWNSGNFDAGRRNLPYGFQQPCFKRLQLLGQQDHRRHGQTLPTDSGTTAVKMDRKMMGLQPL